MAISTKTAQVLIAFAGVCAIIFSTITPLQGQTTRQFQSRNGQIIVTTQRHWDDWERPQGTVEITTTGELMPRLWSHDTDATDDIIDFLGHEIEASDADPITFKALGGQPQVD